LNGQVPDGTRRQVETLLADLKQAMQGDDAARIQQLTSEVQQASMAMGQAMYETGAQGSDQSHGKGQSAADDDEIIEGEFEAA
jgi:molecular chaperone DnaK